MIFMFVLSSRLPFLRRTMAEKESRNGSDLRYDTYSAVPKQHCEYQFLLTKELVPE